MIPDILWPKIGAKAAPVGREVHVWATTLDPGADRLAGYAQTLSSDETERAARFYAERGRRRFAAARGFLRAVLGECTGRDPASLTFVYEARGKPTLADDPLLYFNLSHSGELALLAVTRLGPVGVDVEQIRPMRDAAAIAKRFFSPRESAGLDAASETCQPAVFFNLWTRKEAWLKATGEGISDSLDRVEVSFLPGEPARLVSLFGDPASVADWSMCELGPAPGYVGALAVRAPDSIVRCEYWI